MRGGWACPSIASTARLGQAAKREGAATTRKHNAETRRDFSKVYHAAINPSIQRIPQAWLDIGGCRRPKQGHGAPQHCHKHSSTRLALPLPQASRPIFHRPGISNSSSCAPLCCTWPHPVRCARCPPYFSLWSLLRRGCSGEDEASVSGWINWRLETDIIMPPKINENCQSLIKLPIDHRKKRTFAHATFAREDDMAGFSQIDSTGLSVGLKKGFVVEKRKLAARPASRKGVSNSS